MPREADEVEYELGRRDFVRVTFAIGRSDLLRVVVVTYYELY